MEFTVKNNFQLFQIEFLNQLKHYYRSLNYEINFWQLFDRGYDNGWRIGLYGIYEYVGAGEYRYQRVKHHQIDLAFKEEYLLVSPSPQGYIVIYSQDYYDAHFRVYQYCDPNRFDIKVIAKECIELMTSDSSVRI